MEDTILPPFTKRSLGLSLAEHTRQLKVQSYRALDLFVPDPLCLLRHLPHIHHDFRIGIPLPSPPDPSRLLLFSNALATSSGSTSSTLMPLCSIELSFTGLPENDWPWLGVGCRDGWRSPLAPLILPPLLPEFGAEELETCWERWGIESGLHARVGEV